jgi:hypothetical protein
VVFVGKATTGEAEPWTSVVSAGSAGVRVALLQPLTPDEVGPRGSSDDWICGDQTSLASTNAHSQANSGQLTAIMPRIEQNWMWYMTSRSPGVTTRTSANDLEQRAARTENE